MSAGDTEKVKKIILFDASKKETHHLSSGFKKLFRRLRTNYKVAANKEEISRDALADASLIVFGAPREEFTATEIADLTQWLNGGGRILMMATDGGDFEENSNLKSFLESYGVSCNNDSVMRSVYYKYLHPKEVFIADGILVPDLIKKKNVTSIAGSRKNAPTAGKGTEKGARAQAANEKLAFVYPYGVSLNVQRPSRPLLSSGPISYPMNRPIAAVWESETVAEVGALRGRLVVVGAVDLFSDDWLDKEENAKLSDIIFSWLLSDLEVDMTTDRHDGELLWDYTRIPHVESLSNTIKPCLQGMEELPKDFTRLFDNKMFAFDTTLIPEAVRLYQTLGVPHDPLTLIPPQFECPLPKLAPAIFPPAMREPPPPALDQFDLDEHFAKESLRLAQLTNKCTNGEEDLEYYVAESGDILGVSAELPFGERTAKHILFHIFKQIVDFKKQDAGKSSNYNLDALGPAPAYEYDGGDAVEATAVAVAHISHVDLAPMKSTNRGNLEALQPLDEGFSFGGPALGGAGAKQSKESESSAKKDADNLGSLRDKESDRRPEAKRNAFGGDEMSFDRADAKGGSSNRADTKPNRKGMESDDNVQIMTF
mmetsp:Transcript_26374/g.39129  ORF Transcript_26374/g.39129 Transcript_26374/m.39129 type:complete len:597 (+) Transcript_26374:53-1843(+)|eukprot:CAMPEP_0185028186 /NCGR_PEP_ID=MMETSP1103-20130426/13799_1 /TAXON_ID=36769 /ORGANISM="Paraphysomonas bandaiensis, Strain Caron Lab Isolate" /LENGTH=596 /DNA_ID=CAMNT_0027562527 /DNA_START=44 /DNA_END=1834 /DNA_ORIENTATION=-